MPIHSSALAGALIKALGLPPRCKVITIRLAAGEPVTAELTGPAGLPAGSGAVMGWALLPER